MNFFTRTIKPDEADDDTLLKTYRSNGDLAVLGKLYEKYVSLVYGVCLKYLKDEEQAKDAVMGIFEELVTKAAKHEVRQFRGWIYVLARNYCLMELRAGKKMEMVTLEPIMEFGAEMHHDIK